MCEKKRRSEQKKKDKKDYTGLERYLKTLAVSWVMAGKNGHRHHDSSF